jgi:hypothetical protein
MTGHVNPTPCEVRKVTKITKDENGREILTTETTADCRYNSNQVKEVTRMQGLIDELQARVAKVETIKVDKTFPVDLNVKMKETEPIGEMYVAFLVFFGMLAYRLFIFRRT